MLGDNNTWLTLYFSLVRHKSKEAIFSLGGGGGGGARL